jgi:maltooligosyltrehalose trehalohydrolase
MIATRRYPIGAEPSESGYHFRVWAPDCQVVSAIFENAGFLGEVPLEKEEGGYFSVLIPRARTGDRYRFRLDDDSHLYPDPVSRFQPEGPHGPSELVDPCTFKWNDSDWKGNSQRGRILYEMHVGTFTPEGTWKAATAQLEELAKLGINGIEVMPIGDFPGKFGWGYDGVNLFAPCRLYGTPDDLRHFVDTAHRLGIGIILDVVYNHLGPDGNYLSKFSETYFTDHHHTDWGRAVNFDAKGSAAVREFFCTNAAYWIEEFHLDGLRLDATQNIYDDAPPERHILTEIGRYARRAASPRSIIIINENEVQDLQLVVSEKEGGYGLDAMWNDDFHHSAIVALTGKKEAYYTDYEGSPQEFISAIKYGFLYQGQWYSWQEKRRGRRYPQVSIASFVTFIQNHDQIANTATGRRIQLLTSPGRYRAMTALTLLAPGTPMLFQGQEFAASTPFYYFADHGPELAKLVREGRNEFLSQFPSLRDSAILEQLAKPEDEQTFQRCKLNWRDRETNASEYQLTRDLIQLRQQDPAFQVQERSQVDGAVLSEKAFLLRYFCDEGDRLLLINLGPDLHLLTCPEPLLAPPVDHCWRTRFSTESMQYGGSGVSEVETLEEGWRIPAESAVVLAPEIEIEAHLPRPKKSKKRGGN